MKKDTIYRITKDYDLGNDSLIIPERCILDFQGGSFKNGFIVGNSTVILNNPSYAIFEDCVISNFNLEYFDLRWFGAVENKDCSTAFQYCLKSYDKAILTPIKVVGTYYINKTIRCKNGLNIWNDAFSSYFKNSRLDTTEKVNPVGTLIVKEGITAFHVENLGPRRTTPAREALFSFRGVKFLSSGRKSNLVEYRVGGFPTSGFLFQNLYISGFDKAFYFTGGVAPLGSIAGRVLFDNVVFEDNNYSIYAATKDTTITDMSFSNLEITRCKFYNGSNLHLQGLYGSNCIKLSSFEKMHNPIYASLRTSHLSIDKVYLENITGDIVVESASEQLDFASVLELRELYAINSSYTNIPYNLKFRNICITDWPALLPVTKAYLNNCSLSERALMGSNYGQLKIRNIFLDSGEINNGNKVGSCCVKILPLESINIMDKVRNITMKGCFQLSPSNRVEEYLLPVPMIKMDNKSNVVLEYKDGTLKLLPNQQYNLFFYKGTGILKLNLLDSANNLLESIKLPNNEGMVVVSIIPAVPMNISKATFFYVTSMSVERYISTIGVCDNASIIPISNLMLLPSTD
ncbi:hypothetical protein [uncultured Bacteroides sp.]|uniref:hypothetical protein n=1 Tax=uncultured Bacteroides sp. TaxID=162156 RepID=UPI00261966C7|nr:hypothetical protein [uncultured Bacteroides sp.]